MKFHKVAFLSILMCAFACFLVACTTPKEEAVGQLESLYADVKAHSKSYSIEDWEHYLEEYNRIDTLLKQFEFTDEERFNMSQVKGRCAAYAREAYVIQNANKLNNSLKDSRGVFKGYTNGLQD